MKQALATVCSNDEIATGTFVIRLEEPDQARDARPGQFVHVRCVGQDRFATDPLLRRPLSILRTGANPSNDLASGQYDVLYDVVGRGTRWLADLRPGQFADVLGPLGTPFSVSRSTKRILLVSGGVGIVPMIALAEDALRQNVEVTLLAGFRTVTKVFPPTLVPREVEYIVATDDGTAGHHGFVTSLIADYLVWADQIFACGPIVMLRALARNRITGNLPTQIAMEEHMGCAVGVCLGCVIPTKSGNQRVCRDGPVFDLSEMGWV